MLCHTPEFFSLPSSCASTAVTSSSWHCSTRVSNSTMRLFLKKPYMYALLWALRVEPSMRKSLVRGNLREPASASILFLQGANCCYQWRTMSGTTVVRTRPSDNALLGICMLCLVAYPITSAYSTNSNGGHTTARSRCKQAVCNRLCKFVMQSHELQQTRGFIRLIHERCDVHGTYVLCTRYAGCILASEKSQCPRVQQG